MAKVFVSYARDDSRKMKRVIKKLMEHGFEFWMDTSNLNSGDDWTEKLTRAINACGKFLLFMSDASMSSENVEREVHIAYKKRKKIIIIRLGDSKVPLSLEYQIGRVQWIDYLSPGWEAKIVSALGGGRKFFRKPKPSSSRPTPSTKSLSKKPRRVKSIIVELERSFSGNEIYYKDQCAAALAKLKELHLIAGSHFINPAFAFNELVPRQYFLNKIEVIRDLIQEFQETCPPGVLSKRQLIQNELKALIQELSRKANK